MKMTYTDGDVALDVSYTYKKGENQTYDYVGSADQIEIDSVHHCGVDVHDVLSDKILSDITYIIESKE
jgi:hypothetical protein